MQWGCLTGRFAPRFAPWSAGTGGGELALEKIDGPVVKIKLHGPAASVMTVRVVSPYRPPVPSPSCFQPSMVITEKSACGEPRAVLRLGW